MEKVECKHIVQYYETDKMGITHHSNYIRWMEEARVSFLEKIGLGYSKLEAQGVISPVVNVECNYKKPTTFSDEVTITTYIAEYNGIKFIFKYEMKNAKGELVAEGKSIHVFVDNNNKVVFIDKKYPDLHKVFSSLI